MFKKKWIPRRFMSSCNNRVCSLWRRRPSCEQKYLRRKRRHIKQMLWVTSSKLSNDTRELLSNDASSSQQGKKKSIYLLSSHLKILHRTSFFLKSRLLAFGNKSIKMKFITFIVLLSSLCAKVSFPKIPAFQVESLY